MVAKKGLVLFGNNEDGTHPFTKIWFVPGKGSNYGRVCLGFDDKLEYPFCQGGMNDQGLCIDGSSLKPTGWSVNEKLKNFDTSGLLWGNLCDYLLANFGSVEKVIGFFKTHNINYLKKVKFSVADKTGSLAVIEWGKGCLQVIRETNGYLIATNFVQSNYEPNKYSCPRYKIARHMLRSANNYSVDLIRSILSATHSETSGGTLYSNIFNPKTGNIYLYNFHNFEQVVKMNLKEELKKGKKSTSITALFDTLSFAHLNYLQGALLYNLRRYMKAKISKPDYKRQYFRLKESFKKNFRREIKIPEYSLNRLGYQFVKDNQYNMAFQIFSINVMEYSDSWNAYDSLGEIFDRLGEEKKAIENYKKSLSLNPNNAGGKKALEKLLGYK
jgi:tetratricopeptide (TPR) repeat protein